MSIISSKRSDCPASVRIIDKGKNMPNANKPTPTKNKDQKSRKTTIKLRDPAIAIAQPPEPKKKKRKRKPRPNKIKGTYAPSDFREPFTDAMESGVLDNTEYEVFRAL